ncbi:hypothetical protein BCR37DRAFT_349041 [Protomyces lactucae-debilis]|uniref:Uncharacterized protein n=1 Tax=Protomyces lactucae-debilis TaxID=2754530 RepID=A0A1Y2F9F9_PROLT|nr:uncharacterized protein BCR37DRAFT_349041 [Protomyces lactucae-debilis]ORY80529.1 hypothetical protein BCR37DRAFT_349041 [Protomyces lactucae-debilis]
MPDLALVTGSLAKSADGASASSAKLEKHTGWLKCSAEPQDSHYIIRSRSNPDGKYFDMDFGFDAEGRKVRSTNGNILPDPMHPNRYFMVAHHTGYMNGSVFREVYCEAEFKGHDLVCIAEAKALSVGPTDSNKCKSYGWMNYYKGPHDARVSWSPTTPYIVYGTQSQFCCFGQYIHDLRALMPIREAEPQLLEDFAIATELQRPAPWGEFEKNWFLFYVDDQKFVHHDVYPKRSFAKLEADGSVGEQLSGDLRDEACISKLMPELVQSPGSPEHASIHQSTNSLSVTLCNRGECTPSKDNTVILTIFQLKELRYYHPTYEPYVMLIQQQAPYRIHGIAKLPFWVHGRGREPFPEWKGEDPSEFTQMFYIVSVSWKSRTQRYQGFLDDELFVSFGIEDNYTASIDVRAHDLVQCIGLCSDISVGQADETLAQTTPLPVLEPIV